MRKTAILLAALAVAGSVSAFDTRLKMIIKNPGDKRKAQPIVMPLEGNVKCVTVMNGDKQLPCQLDDFDGDGIYDEVAFLTDLKENEKQTLDIFLSDEGIPNTYPVKTYAYLGIRDRDKTAKHLKHQEIQSFTFPAASNPYNYIFPHGAVMENEMVGFRVYADHRQSIDYYGHKNLKMDIEETGFYPSKEQVAAGSGDDVLYTGSTYGCGAMHGWNDSTSVMFNRSRFHTQTVVTKGPVRTILDISNKGWEPYEGCKPVDVCTRYILYAGRRDVEVQVKFSRPVPDIPLSTGIVEIVETCEEMSDKDGLRGCWGTACAGNNPKVYDTHTVGLGVCVPKQYYKRDSHFSDKLECLADTTKKRLPNQAYVQVMHTDTDNLHYWFTATCDMETFGFKDKSRWFLYLTNWKETVLEPVNIEIVKISR